MQNELWYCYCADCSPIKTINQQLSDAFLMSAIEQVPARTGNTPKVVDAKIMYLINGKKRRTKQRENIRWFTFQISLRHQS